MPLFLLVADDQRADWIVCGMQPRHARNPTCMCDLTDYSKGQILGCHKELPWSGWEEERFRTPCGQGLKCSTAGEGGEMKRRTENGLDEKTKRGRQWERMDFQAVISCGWDRDATLE